MATTGAFRNAWRLVKPYWFSEDRWRGRGLLALIVSLSLGQVYIAVCINAWNARFYNALQDKQVNVYVHELLIFAGLAACHIAIVVYQQYFMQMLRIRWRSWMTHRCQSAWLSARAYYRMQVLDRRTDNPDQRIADDVDIFTSSTLSLSIDLLSSVVTLVSFVTILWGLSGAYRFHLGGQEFTISGYMVWAALLYAVVGSFLTHFIGRKLVRLNFHQQQFEANYRYSLIRVRENAESIAFYHGEGVEDASLRDRFGRIVANWWGIMRKQKQLTWFVSGYNQIAIIFPFVVAAPRYFAGEIALGGLMQTASAFGQVRSALSWFVESYTQFANWKATVDRLSGFLDAVEAKPVEAPAQAIHRDRHAVEEVSVHGLRVNLPDGEALTQPMDLNLKPGDRLLIRGASGKGKTTLLRALAGLWPYGAGSIHLPEAAKTLFVPQRSYMPNLPLRDALCYPDGRERHTDEELREALRAVGLPQLIDDLDGDTGWAQALSPGEQQKVAFARVLLRKPEVLFMDESTASLDEEAEIALYTLLIKTLPQCVVVSVGHHTRLKEFHTAERVL